MKYLFDVTQYVKMEGPGITHALRLMYSRDEPFLSVSANATSVRCLEMKAALEFCHRFSKENIFSREGIIN